MCRSGRCLVGRHADGELFEPVVRIRASERTRCGDRLKPIAVVVGVRIGGPRPAILYEVPGGVMSELPFRSAADGDIENAIAATAIAIRSRG